MCGNHLLTFLTPYAPLEAIYPLFPPQAVRFFPSKGRMMKKGYLITFEGIDGAGKSSVVSHLELTLIHQGMDVVTTREPGGTETGTSIREILLHSNEPLDETTQLLLHFAARRQHIHEVIAPALRRGALVICDRFTDSTYAYQGGGQGVPYDTIQALSEIVHPTITPDFTLLFDLDPSCAENRRGHITDKDRYERANTDFFKRVRSHYLQRAKANSRFVIVDSSLDQAHVIQCAKDAVLGFLNTIHRTSPKHPAPITR